MENKEEPKRDIISTIKNIIIIILVIILIGLCSYIVFNEDHKASVKDSIEKNNTTTKVVENEYVSVNTYKEKTLKDSNDSINIKLNGKDVNLSYKLIKEDRISSESGYEYDYETEIIINGNTNTKDVKLTNVSYYVIKGLDNKEYLVLYIYEVEGFETSWHAWNLLVINDNGEIIYEGIYPIYSEGKYECPLSMGDGNYIEVIEDGIYYANNIVYESITEDLKATVTIGKIVVNNSKVELQKTDRTSETKLANCS